MTPLASGMQTPSEITWTSYDNHATTCHLCHLIGRPGTEGPNPLFLPNLFLSYCVLMLSEFSAVVLHVPILIPNSEANCMHPLCPVHIPSLSPPCRQLPSYRYPPVSVPNSINVPETLWFYLYK